MLVLAGAAPGTAFALYVTGYAAARFARELARGDAGRSAAWGLTQRSGSRSRAPARSSRQARPDSPRPTPRTRWSAPCSRSPPRRSCWSGGGTVGWDAGHAQELLAAVRDSLGDGSPTRVVETSAGVSVSGGMLDTPAPVRHVSVSRRDGAVPAALGHTLRNDIRALAPESGAGELRRGAAGVLHVLVRAR